MPAVRAALRCYRAALARGIREEPAWREACDLFALHHPAWPLPLAECEAKAYGRGPFWLPGIGKRMAEVLAEAGLSTSAAHRYEELAGGRQERAQHAAKAAAETYFAKARHGARHGDLRLTAFVARLQCEVCCARPVVVELRGSERDLFGRPVPGRMALELPLAWTWRKAA